MGCPLTPRAPVYIVMSLVGIIGQSIILYFLRKCSKLYKPCYKILQSLCMADILFGISVCLLVVNVASCNALWDIPQMLSRASGVISAMTAALLSVDRFLAVKRGLSYQRLADSKIVEITIVAVWSISFLILGLCLVETPINVVAKVTIRLSTDVFLCTATYLSAFITGAVNIYLFQSSRKQISKILKQVESFQDTPAAKNEIAFWKRRRRLSREVIIINCSTIVTSLAITFTVLKRILAPSSSDEKFALIVHFCAAVQQMINPAVYIFVMSDLKAEVKACWYRHQRKVHIQTNASINNENPQNEHAPNPVPQEKDHAKDQPNHKDNL